ncbi:protein N-lysine methyltransferase METTL21A-like [Actinia tenebrosa]|uniref:Protein N-lysine methyltransferase METTL21A-like n=1 Tax=Actinia tenebrosa TaxID=6105 RepID=A0A6P8IGJ3_ACTTE|nr:protein N-lysine methyltransferase METTL21A-like [Actinia tenebrosa]
MWVRQEYKPEKARFQKPFEIDIELATQKQVHREEEQEEQDAEYYNGKQKSENKSTRKIKLEQSYAALGTTVWDGSIALAKMFDNQMIFPQEDFKNYRVLELGAGCGLVGIYLCLLGAKRTVITDQQCCIPTLNKNIELNIAKDMASRIKAEEYSWGNGVDHLTKNGVFDLVVAAEVLYSEEDSIKLAKSIPRLTHQKSLVFVSMGRNRGGESAFVRTMKNEGFEVQEVAKEHLHPKYQDSIIKVLKAYLPQGSQTR